MLVWTLGITNNMTEVADYWRLPCFKAIFLLYHPHRDLERSILLDIDPPDLVFMKVPSLVVTKPTGCLPGGLRGLDNGVIPREELWAECPPGHGEGSMRGSKAYDLM